MLNRNNSPLKIGAFFLALMLTNLLNAQDSIPTFQSTPLEIKDTVPTTADTLTKFNKFNKKMEVLFKKIPVPIISYSTEAGQVFGLAKFDIIELKKGDTITKPSKLSEVVTFSTKGKINASISAELVFNQNKYILLTFMNYRKEPEYFFGIGNDVVRENMEQVEYSRYRFNATNLFLVAKDLYVGVPFDLATYFDIKSDSSSYIVKNNVTGKDGGFSVAPGIAAAYDARDNRYNPYKGAYILYVLYLHAKFLGSYEYIKTELDARKYFNPWKKHVIALQATTTYTSGDVPYYDLALMGGDNKMRGYYLGAYRDKVLLDAQVEYRMPVWNVFGIVAWIGAGRVAPSYSQLNLNGFRLSYGGGIRVRVDSKHNTNLRLDFGYGPNGMSGFYINFAEAF